MVSLIKTLQLSFPHALVINNRNSYVSDKYDPNTITSPEFVVIFFNTLVSLIKTLQLSFSHMLFSIILKTVVYLKKGIRLLMAWQQQVVHVILAQCVRELAINVNTGHECIANSNLVLSNEYNPIDCSYIFVTKYLNIL